MSIKKSHLFMLILFVLVAAMLVFFNPSDVFAGGPSVGVEGGEGIGQTVVEEDENILLKILGIAFGFIANTINLALGSTSIDSLVYNQDGVFTGLSLFKPGDVQDFLVKFYKLFNYIAIALFIPIAFWGTMSFVRAGDSPQGKSVLKDKMLKLVLTFALLYTMPELMTLLVKVSNAFVDIFHSVASQLFGTTNPIGEYLRSSADVNAEGSQFVRSMTSLMLIGINVWMIFFYIIRDLTIAFLFMFFPIVAIWFPMSEGMVLNWWKNMASNVLGQPIQAVILSLVLAMSNAINAVDMGFLGGLYMIVAFGSIIPMTGIIKGFLGLEGGVGAASSRAGLGGAMAAMTMMRMASRNASNNKDMIREGKEERSRLEDLEKRQEKNLEPASEGTALGRSDYDKPLVNPTSGNLSTNEILKQKREANKKVIRGRTALATGVFTALGGAALSGGMGGRSAAIGAMAGYGAGSIAGGNMGEHISDISEGKRINERDTQDIRNLQMTEAKNALNIDPSLSTMEQNSMAREALENDPELYQRTLHTAQEKQLGIYNKDLSGTEFQNKEREALLKQRRISNAGSSYQFRDAARKAYTSNAPARYSNEEIMTMQGVNLYQDKDISYLYKQENGQMEILKTAPGVSGMVGSMDSPVAFNQESVGMPSHMSVEMDVLADQEAGRYMAESHPEISLTSQEYAGMHMNRKREILSERRHMYQDGLKATRENFGISNLNVTTNEQALAMQVERRKAHMAQVEMRKEQAAIQEATEKRLASDPLREAYAKLHDPANDTIFADFV